MKVTCFLEILSSWCHWAEPAWAELKARFDGRVTFDWRIALMNLPDFPRTREECDWYYRRSGGVVMRSPYMLDSGWFEPELKGDYAAPNLVAEAGRDFGVNDDRLRLALSHAALREGRRIGRMDEAARIGSAAIGVPAGELHARAESDAVRARVDASTAAFHTHRITQRPAFILEDDIGDKAVFSGLVVVAPLASTIEAMLADTAGYAAARAHLGPPPVE